MVKAQQSTAWIQDLAFEEKGRFGLADPPSAWPAEHYLGTATARDFRGLSNALCVTIYNESLEVVQATLGSLAKALSHWCVRSTRHDHASAICLVIDGIDQADPALMLFLRERGFVADIDRLEADQTTHFYSLHDLEEWSASPSRMDACAEPLRFVVCVKHCNRGKLDSHVLFFGALCEQIEPAVCFQLDAGTVIEADAVAVVLEHLQSCPESGAVATRVGCAAPTPSDSLLQRWQYMDFATQLATHWPAEETSGHLSVIPGQFCAFRWSALKNLPRQRTDSTDTSDDHIHNPVSRYLRGMFPASAMERIMFLAEDRVIGNELVLARGQGWRLDYCRGAVATTDACGTLGELLRQRRRWNNCSFACRVWLLGQWPALLKRSDRGLREKARLSCAMVWQIVLSLLQAVAPASALCVTLAVWGAMLSTGRGGHMALTLAALGTLALSLLLTLYTPGLAPKPMRAYAAVRDVIATSSLCLRVACVGLSLSWEGVVLLFLPAAISAALPLMNERSQPMKVLRHVPEFLSVNGFVQVILWGYAIARLKDTSWGTKGLHSTQPAAADGQSMRRYSNRVILSWGALNTALIAAALTYPGLWVPDLNPVAEAVGLITALTTLMAVIGLTRNAAKRAWQRRGDPAAIAAADLTRPARNSGPLLAD